MNLMRIFVWIDEAKVINMSDGLNEFLTKDDVKELRKNRIRVTDWNFDELVEQANSKEFKDWVKEQEETNAIGKLKERIAKLKGKTNWAELRNQMDEEINLKDIPEVTEADIFTAMAKIGEPCPKCHQEEPDPRLTPIKDPFFSSIPMVDAFNTDCEIVESISEPEFVSEKVVHVDDAYDETLTEINYTPDTGFLCDDLYKDEDIITLLDDLNVLNEDGEDTFKVQYTEDEDDGNFYMFTIKCHDVKNSLSLMLTKDNVQKLMYALEKHMEKH
jgi:hypothetical protein